MKDNEFSSPGQEFSSPGREFSPPGQEWSRAGREFSAPSSGEPPRKKKRRLNPLMLTAAAVVTAAVVLGSSPAPRVEYPTCPLTQEHRAYLDTVWETMEQRDIDELQVLSQDPRLKDLVENYIKPYARMIDKTYEDMWIVDYETYAFNDYTDIPFAEGGSYCVYYDGTDLGILECFPDLGKSNLLWVQYYLETSFPESSSSFHSNASFQLAQRPSHDTSWSSILFDCDIWDTWTNVNWYDLEYQTLQLDNDNSCTFVPVSGTVMYYNKTSGYDNTWCETTEQMEGDFLTLWSENPEFNSQPCYETFLENGTVEYSHISDQNTGHVKLEVQNGNALPNDQVFSTFYEDVSGRYMNLLGRCSDGTEWCILSRPVQTEKELFHHLVQFRNYSHYGIF